MFGDSRISEGTSSLNIKFSGEVNMTCAGTETPEERQQRTTLLYRCVPRSWAMTHYRTALRIMVTGLFFLSSDVLCLPGEAQLLPLWYFRTANDIPPSMYKNSPIISCIVAKVTDGDTVRVQHKPWWLLFPKNDGKLTDRTISVRLYGIDAPETGQPWGEEATRFVKSCLVSKRQVRVKLLARDRYGRAVGAILYRKRYAFFWQLEDLSKELLKKGLAILFNGKGIVSYRSPSTF